MLNIIQWKMIAKLPNQIMLLVKQPQLTDIPGTNTTKKEEQNSSFSITCNPIQLAALPTQLTMSPIKFKSIQQNLFCI